MSFVLLKNLLFGGRQTSKEKYEINYHKLRDHDLESASTASDLSYDSDLLEKSTSTPSSPRSPTMTPTTTLIPHPHISPRLLSDATLGLSDGLTVPFALTAGLFTLSTSTTTTSTSSSPSSTHLVLLGGLAELAAGALSMGLGGYLASHTEADAASAQARAVRALVRKGPEATEAAVREAFRGFGLEDGGWLDGLAARVAAGGQSEQEEFLMRFCGDGSGDADGVGREEEQGRSRAWTSAGTIAGGYLVGGLMPLLPYAVIPAEEIVRAFWCSVALMVVALFVFGAGKTVLVGGVEGREVQRWVGGGVQMVVLGGMAAGAAMVSVRAFGAG
ncbi:MAG: hypothetical protein M1822_009515 [Bathelium mastoideum]|nr:MAG: hypothetical protein M1822_009515 [Bathelium mastoideum]